MYSLRPLATLTFCTSRVAVVDDKSSGALAQYPDLGGLGRVLSLVEVGPALALFQRRPGRGRRPYGRLPLIYGFLASYYLNIRTIQGLVDRLHNNPALRNVCGFTSTIPSRSTFSRAFSKLAQNREVLYGLFQEVTRRVLDLHPTCGRLVAVDSTTVQAYANPNHKKTRDQEAGWTKSYSASSTSDDGLEWVFGYKAHVLACVESALPLAFIITPANVGDSPLLPPLVSMAQESYQTLNPTVLMADKGYDARSNCQFLHDQNIAPIIPMRDHSNRGNGKPVYTINGEPICLGGQPMEFTGTDPATGCHGFRCPPEGCHRRQEPFKGYTVCDDVVWENPDDDVYAVGGKVSRASAEWRRLYAIRWEIERYFSLLKDNHWVEDHRCRGLAKVGLHITLAMLMYQAMTLDRMLEQGVEAPRRELFRAA